MICRQCKKWRGVDIELLDHVDVMRHIIGVHADRALTFYKKVTASPNVFYDTLANEAVRDRGVEGEYL